MWTQPYQKSTVGKHSSLGPVSSQRQMGRCASSLITDILNADTYIKRPNSLSSLFCARRRFAQQFCKPTFFMKIDLINAFISVAIPEKLRYISAFRWKNSTNTFNRLPMGLFFSPFVLQKVVRTILLPTALYIWVHLNDILIWGATSKQVHRKATEKLSKRRVLLSTQQKSNLKATQTICYCGVWLTPAGYSIAPDKQEMLKLLAREGTAWPPILKRHQRIVGFITYIIATLQLSSVWIKLWAKGFGRHIVVALTRKTCTWARRPRQAWASDAVEFGVVVDHKNNGVIRTKNYPCC